MTPDVEDGVEATKIGMWFRREAASDLDILTIYQGRSWEPGKLDSSTLTLNDTEVTSGPAVTDSFAAGFRSTPGYSTSTSVTRHNYLDLRTPHAVRWFRPSPTLASFASTPRPAPWALDLGNGWCEVDEGQRGRDGSLHPVLDSKEMPFPGGSAYADISTTDGAGARRSRRPAPGTPSTSGSPMAPAVNATPSAASSNITSCFVRRLHGLGHHERAA